MKTPEQLNEIFNKFAGREVEATENTRTRTIRGKEYTLTSAVVDDEQPVLKEMREAAAKNGLSLRVWLPDSMGTMDYRTDRVNAHIVKEDDGKYRISPNFSIG